MVLKTYSRKTYTFRSVISCFYKYLFVHSYEMYTQIAFAFWNLEIMMNLFLNFFFFYIFIYRRFSLTYACFGRVILSVDKEYLISVNVSFIINYLPVVFFFIRYCCQKNRKKKEEKWDLSNIYIHNINRIQKHSKLFPVIISPDFLLFTRWF